MSYVPPALRARQGGGDGPSTSEGPRGGFERSGSAGAFDRAGSGRPPAGAGASAGAGGGAGAGAGGDRWGGGGGPSSAGPPERRPPLFRSGSNSSLGGDGGPRAAGGPTGGSSGGGGGGGGGGGYRSRGGDPPPVVLGEHKLSDRVNALTEEQIDEIRGRLNVLVEVEDGEPPPAPPVESFKEMVRANVYLQQDMAAALPPPSAPLFLLPLTHPQPPLNTTKTNKNRTSTPTSCRTSRRTTTKHPPQSKRKASPSPFRGATFSAVPRRAAARPPRSPSPSCSTASRSPPCALETAPSPWSSPLLASSRSRSTRKSRRSRARRDATCARPLSSEGCRWGTSATSCALEPK